MRTWLEILLSKNNELGISASQGYMIERYIGELIMKLSINDEEFLKKFVMAFNNARNNPLSLEEKNFFEEWTIFVRLMREVFRRTKQSR